MPPSPLPLPDPPLGDDAAGVVLRPWSEDDAGALAAAWADPAVAGVTDVPAARTRADARAWIAGDSDRRAAGVALDLVVAGRTDGEVRGEVGLVVRDPVRRWAEVGFWIGSPYRGAGHATAAVRLITEWALGPELGLAQVYARVHRDNESAGAVLAGAGFERRGPTEGSHVVWRRRAPDQGGATVRS